MTYYKVYLITQDGSRVLISLNTPPDAARYMALNWPGQYVIELQSTVLT